MKYLITGGAGFIGSHLADAMLSEGHHVAVLDDLSTGAAANIAHLRQHERFSLHWGSVLERSAMAELVDEADVIVHLAAAVGVKLIVESAVRTIETNVTGTEKVLQLASKKGKKVIIASTSEVYGKSAKLPFSEDDDLVMGPTIRNRWSYACSKALDEFLALAYCRERRTPVVIVRFFNTVGPRQTGTYGMVLPRFVQQALANQPITIYGDGNQRRCFGYVGDVVRGVIALSQEPSAVGEVFNLGSDREITIKQLAELVREVTGSCSELAYIPYEQAYGSGFEDMQRRVPDLRKAEKFIGYRPTIGVREIVERVADYFRARSNGRPASPVAVAGRHAEV